MHDPGTSQSQSRGVGQHCTHWMVPCAMRTAFMDTRISHTAPLVHPLEMRSSVRQKDVLLRASETMQQKPPA